MVGFAPYAAMVVGRKGEGMGKGGVLGTAGEL